MTKTAGIDIGSRTIKFVLLTDSRVVDYRIVDTGTDPLANSKSILADYKFDTIVATGYGRHLIQNHFGFPVITEIKAYAIGAHFLFPHCRTVIDIGGQDSKIIKIRDGQVVDFEMNDRCAAGTGKFLEVMAHTLGFPLEELGEEALKAESSVPISSMCTVFAESEVISLIARGENPKNIALGLHESILARLLSMLGRIGFEDEIVFAGGVAKNRCLAALLEKRLKKKILIPPEPQIVGALGAALKAGDNDTSSRR
ncbi:MAG: acyl-CoA dehydratase activase [candidate division WOR-3 bacterium]